MHIKCRDPRRVPSQIPRRYLARTESWSRDYDPLTAPVVVPLFETYVMCGKEEPSPSGGSGEVSVGRYTVPECGLFTDTRAELKLGWGGTGDHADGGQLPSGPARRHGPRVSVPPARMVSSATRDSRETSSGPVTSSSPRPRRGRRDGRPPPALRRARPRSRQPHAQGRLRSTRRAAPPPRPGPARPPASRFLPQCTAPLSYRSPRRRGAAEGRVRRSRRRGRARSGPRGRFPSPAS